MEYENDMKELAVVDVENVEIENTAESADEALVDGEVEMVACSVRSIFSFYLIFDWL